MCVYLSNASRRDRRHKINTLVYLTKLYGLRFARRLARLNSSTRDSADTLRYVSKRIYTSSGTLWCLAGRKD